MGDFMKIGKLQLVGLAGALAALTLGATTATARDPAYAAARVAGEIGEQTDGYLGIVGAATPELRRMVNDLNIKRKAVYARKAQEQHATIEEYAFTSGCVLISQTRPGEKYQTPTGSWATRTSAPPQRDSRCP